MGPLFHYLFTKITQTGLNYLNYLCAQKNNPQKSFDFQGLLGYSQPNRTLEVGGSTPLCSTNDFNGLHGKSEC